MLRYSECMTHPEPPALADIEAAAARRAEDEARLHTSSDTLRHLVLDALRSGKHRPTDVTRASGWTGAYVRKLAREAGIEPNERYKARAAALRKTPPTAPEEDGHG